MSRLAALLKAARDAYIRGRDRLQRVNMVAKGVDTRASAFFDFREKGPYLVVDERGIRRTWRQERRTSLHLQRTARQ